MMGAVPVVIDSLVVHSQTSFSLYVIITADQNDEYVSQKSTIACKYGSFSLTKTDTNAKSNDMYGLHKICLTLDCSLGLTNTASKIASVQTSEHNSYHTQTGNGTPY